MRRIQVVRPLAEAEARRAGPGQRVAPAASTPEGRRRLDGGARCWPASPAEASIWLDLVELEVGSGLACGPDASDQALYVERGAVAIAGQVCPAGGAVVIERGAACRVEALEPTRLLHMGSLGGSNARRALGPPDAHAPSPPSASSAERASRIHVVGPRGVFEAVEPGRRTHFFADATCPSCDVWLLRTGRDTAYASPVHSHARDELIHVLAGEVAIGSLRVGPGETLFVAANQPYRFCARAGGFAFVNFRNGPSRMTMRATGEQIVENGAATGMRRVEDTAG